MDISFNSEQLEAECTQPRLLMKRNNKSGMRKMRQRLSDLNAAVTLADMRSLPGHCEELTGDRQAQFSMRLDGALRLIFRPNHDPIPTKVDGGIDWTRVTAILILEVVDYHD